MAYGTTGSVQTDENGNPIESTRRTSQFEYTPVTQQPSSQTDDLMRQVFERSMGMNQIPQQPRGPTPYWENPDTYYPQQQQQRDPVEQSKAATAAAYKYIAFRGYQQDLKNGASVADAVAKWWPMLMGGGNFGTVMKALQKPAPYVFNQQTKAYESPSGSRPYFQPESTMARPDVALDANIKEIDGQKFYQNPKTGSVTKLSSEGTVNPLDLVDYRSAGTSIAEANKVLMDQYATPAARAAATNVINQANEIQKGVRGSKKPVSAPDAPTTIKKFTWNKESGTFNPKSD